MSWFSRIILAGTVAVALASSAVAQNGSKVVFAAAANGQTGAMQTGARASGVTFTFCGTGFSGNLYVDAAATSSALAQVWTTTLTLNSDCATTYAYSPASKWYRVRWTRSAGKLDVWMSIRQGEVTPGGLTGPVGGLTAGRVVLSGGATQVSDDAGLTYDAATDTLTAGTVAQDVSTATTVRVTSPAALTVTGSTNATPIVVTAVGHGLVTGDLVSISGITGNTNANGLRLVTRLTADTFSLQDLTGADVAGNGTHGGTPVAVSGIVLAGRVLASSTGITQPAYSFSDAPLTGITYPGGGTGRLGFVSNAVEQMRLSGTFLSFPSTFRLAWTNGTLTGTIDTELGRYSPRWAMFGATAAASPNGYTLSGQGGLGTNIAGGRFTLAGGPSTGNAIGGSVAIATSPAGTSGTGVNAPVDRLVVAENGDVSVRCPYGGAVKWVTQSEEITLSTAGNTTDSTLDLLVANSVIEMVSARVTEDITAPATDWQMGDATTAGRFSAANATLTAGTTDVGLVYVDQTGAAGPKQTSAGKLRITTTGTPGAGKVRVTTVCRVSVPPTT